MRRVTDQASGKPAAARRGELRLPMAREARLDGPAGMCSVLVTDLSRGGAALDLGRPPASGERVVFRLDELVLPATICWSRAGSCGLLFDAPIRATDLLVQARRNRDCAAPAAMPLLNPGSG